ncbi:hypothetical protein QFZ56_002626 [Streptomyces achromogenes]|uniref:Uncharacterized protein n=1 Tax=Streptomyces achromogenes TaxID=67255 RepID=A0ABU0PZ17_STRAH|nr:hypothetical protein [Streptomyces achromogenes]MDQ0683663.1 hypothetical protein [Streptomyces achromogenes]
MSEYSVAISNLVGDDPARNVESIKSAVIANLRSSDEAMRVESTEYFNHTYAPDLVLRWVGSKEERQVFLRTNTNPQYLREDIAVISERQPILMPLAPLRDQGHTEELGRESANARTLVTDPDSLQTFSADRQDRPVLGLLSRAVLQGGKGLVDQTRARSTSEAVGLGFAGAQRAEADQTRGAVEAAESLLDPSHADQFTRLLHAVWLGSGASPASFPGATDVRPDLDAQGLKLLLEIAVAEDEEFWQRIGSGVSLAQLCEIEMPASSVNLQRLVSANLDQFKAKSCRVSDALTKSGYGAEPRWFTHGGVLGYTTDRYRALFSVGPISSMDFMEEIEDGSVGLPELLDRAADAEVVISELTIESAAGGQIEYTAPPLSLGTEVILDDLRGALGQRSSVRTAVISLGGTRHIKCDLTKRAATGRTVAKIYLSEFMQGAIPLLRTLRRSEYGELLRLMDSLPDAPVRRRREIETDDDAAE